MKRPPSHSVPASGGGQNRLSDQYVKRHACKSGGDESAKSPPGRGLPPICFASTGRRSHPWVARGPGRYSPVTFTGAAPAEPVFASSKGLLLGARLAALREAELFDSTKSEMRGTISDRNREPLNTP